MITILRLYNKDYEIVDEMISNGGEPKIWIFYMGMFYLCKFQKVKVNRHGSEMWSNVYSEHYASKFINITGGKSHKTLLAEIELDGEFKKCVLCKDFTCFGGELKTFKENTLSNDTDFKKYEYYFDEILYVLSKIHKVEFSEVYYDFWSMYIYDIILGNFDRHSGN